MLAHYNTFAAQLRADSVASMYETFTYNGGHMHFRSSGPETFLYYNKKLFAEAACVHHQGDGLDQRGASASSSMPPGCSPNATARAGSVSGDSSTPGPDRLLGSMFGMNNELPRIRG